jgi:hypothetical protein
MNQYSAKFKMGMASDVSSFADFEQYAKKETLKLKQQLLFDFAATKYGPSFLTLFTKGKAE